MLRISGGEFRSRRLLSPVDESISRPYGSRIKESVFNLLRGWVEGATVLDLFAGVGTMGLEAVSRGATTAVMVERNRSIFELLQENIARLGCQDRAGAVNADAFGSAWQSQAQRQADLVFLDPPYELMATAESLSRVLKLLERCRRHMADRGFLVLRSPLGADEADFAAAGFTGPEDHRYGSQMHVLLYAPAITPTIVAPSHQEG